MAKAAPSALRKQAGCLDERVEEHRTVDRTGGDLPLAVKQENGQMGDAPEFLERQSPSVNAEWRRVHVAD